MRRALRQTPVLGEVYAIKGRFQDIMTYPAPATVLPATTVKQLGGALQHPIYMEEQCLRTTSCRKSPALKKGSRANIGGVALLRYLLCQYRDAARLVTRQKQRLIHLEKVGDVREEARERFGDTERLYDIGSGGSPFEIYKRNLLKAMKLLMSEDSALADYYWLRELPGLSTLGCATLLAHVDIERASTVRSFWKFCGLAVVDGKAERRKRGVKNAFCAPVKKMLLWEVATTLAKKDGDRLASYQAYYAGRHEDWTKQHVNMAARRRIVKLWAAKLWEQWRNER